MTPLFFSFFTLCVSLAGVDDCSYSWEVIQDRAEFEDIYVNKYNGTSDPVTVAAFTIQSAKVVVLTPGKFIEQITHEYWHVICNLEYDLHKEYELAKNCHMKVDLVYLAPQRVTGYDDWQGVTDNTPPDKTQRMVFQEQMFSNKYINKTAITSKQ